ncbi:MAG TPA: YCF48-related protein, partial [Flavobacteriales bacterium]|nr:YCF48-related protein [Flavobacteriales bacterium]
MSRTLIALSLFSGTLSLSAQWEALPAPIIDIFSIQALDAQTLRAGGNGSLLLSDDGGDSWDTTHITFLGTEFPGLLYDVYFTSTTNGFAVGAFSSNQALVLHTTDGGQDWSPAYFDEVGTAPLTTEAIAFPTSSVGIVVGSSGKVLRSTTSGSSWALVASGTTSRLYDVEFTSATTGCAVGENVILRTTNAGLNWTVQSVSGSLRSVSFSDANNGFAIGAANALFRTVNGGASWQAVVPLLMTLVDFTAIHAASASLLYATGDNRMWRSTDAGIHWEWQSAPASLQDVTFIGGVGFAVGAAGTIMRTGDSEGPYAPSPYFTIAPAIACEDSILTCSNGSAPGLSFTWLLNGLPFSTSEDAVVILPEPAQLDTIGLVASNGL